ncbi:hypothetical protein ERO13_D06G109950v2 [Gossypium hirsutum]|uniref:Uncharacterized protein n=2 Tax=Gossypium TaxID=3633 RepID=A0A5J5R0W3_GOSBA|nr:hypothetical protein ES319_D06G127000v1 [Gossypium barbadense]KAG4142042.1 hypothetical protein ERO13_D06G109950v2 [Gossypium hirsutum]TYI77196.1 hypothetical protein E1A91_D06G128700v1 [Gossypium mustelinum]
MKTANGIKELVICSSQHELLYIRKSAAFKLGCSTKKSLFLIMITPTMKMISSCSEIEFIITNIHT